MPSRALVVSLVVGLGGCSLAPKYQRPPAPVAADWPAAPAQTPGAPGQAPAAPGDAVAAADLGWRDFLGDRRLQEIVALALENNRDLRIAVENVELARAQFRIERSALVPSVSATASGVRQHTPADVSATGQEMTSSQYSVGANASWELDLFGRVQSLSAAALEQYLATREARRAVQLTLVADLAAQYLAERSCDEQLEIARRTLADAQASERLTRVGYQHGQQGELDVRMAESAVASARYAEAALLQRREQARNALVLLVGRELPAELPPPRSLTEQGLLADLPAGVPSELLVRRPDVLQAEHVLRAANADIGAARAAFFPSITLTAAAGTTSAQLSGLFGSGSGAWSFAPQVNLPIFAGGRNVANLDAAQTRKRIEIARYEKSIQSAFREVADALAARATARAQIEAQEARVVAERRRHALATLRYAKGASPYLEVLTAEQELFGAEQLLVQTREAHLANLVALYRALGGGWNERSAAAGASGPPAAARSVERGS